jgi:hypothetical protein
MVRELVKIVARRVGVSLSERDMHREIRDQWVTLLVDDADEDGPDFRG